MNQIYLVILFILAAALTYTYGIREHLTIQEVANKVPPLEERIETLEDEYKSIQQKMTQQEAQAKAATSQATNLQAALHSSITT
jgi:pantothenate kinase